MTSFKLKISLLLTIAVMMGSVASAAIPSGYYDNARGKTQQALLTALQGIVQPSTNDVLSYDGLWNAFKTTDVDSNGKIIDMYSNVEWTPGSKQCGTYKNVGSCYNREHSMPKSWFNEGTPMYSDLFHLYPTDGYVNNQRSNYPFGECANGTRLTNGSYEGKGKLGTCTYPGYSGKVFEPDDEYKGDFARTYFYMAAAYNNKIANWTSSDTNLGGNSYPAFNTWSVTMLMEWHRADPVSAKETARNEAVYGIQGNRNPFIDHPEMAEYIWGNNKNDSGGWQDTASTTPTLSAPTAGSTISVGTTTANTAITKSVTIAGSNLTSAITLSLSGTNSGLFALSTTSVSATAANSGTTVTVTYTPTANGTHTATLTLSSSDFSTRTVTLTGTASDSGSGSGDSGSGAYVKVTDVTKLSEGDEVIIVSEDSNVAMGAQSNKIRSYGSVTISDNTITVEPSSSGVHAFTLGGTSAGWTFYDKTDNSGYLSYTGSSNEIYTVEAVSSNSEKWTVSTTQIANVASSTRLIQYNSGSPRFACYSSSQKKAVLYKKQGGSSEPEPDPTIDIDPTGTIALTATTGSESAAEDVTVTVADNSSDVTVAVSNSTYFELSDDDGETWSSSLTLGQYGGGISVRAKAIANAGTYTATLTATAGSVSEQRNLSVTVTAIGTPEATPATDVTASGFTANWQELTGVDGYELHVYTQTSSGSASTETIASNFSDKNLTVGSGGLIWSTDTDATQFETASPSRGVQWSSGNSPTLTASITGNPTITKVTVKASTNGTSSSLAVSVGGTSYGSHNVTSGTNAANTDYEFTGNSSGEISIAVTNTTSKTFWIKSITVEYTTGGGSTTTNEITGSPFTINGASTTSKAITGLEAETTYYYHLYGLKNDAVATAQSNVINLTTLASDAPTPTPELIVDPASVTIAETNVGENGTGSFSVLGSNLTGNVTITVGGTDATLFSVNPATIAAADAEEGATITVTYAPEAAGTHTATFTLASDGATPVTVNVSASAVAQQSGESTSMVFEKITSASALVPGRKILIVYNASNSTTQALGFDGSLTTLDAVGNNFNVYFNNNDNTIINADENDMARTFTLLEGSTSDKYYIKSASGYYIGQNSYANSLTTNTTASSTLDNTINFDSNGYVLICGNGASGDVYVTLKYNNSNNQNRFRYYKSGQQSIYLYQQQGSTTPTPTTLGEAVGTSSIDLPVNIAYVDGNGIAYGCASAGENQITEGNASEKSANAGTYSDDFTKYDQRDWVAISGLTNPSQYLGKTISGFKGSRNNSKPGYYYVATSQPTSVTAQSGDNNVPANEYQVHNLVASPDDNDYVRPQVYEYTTKFYASLKKENGTWKAFGTSAGNDVSILLDTSLFASTTGWVESSGSNYNTLEGIFVTTGGASSSPRLREVDLGSQSYQFLITKAPTTEDIPTGINGIGSDNEAMKVRGIYNLQGQRVRATVPGQFYIINGKKTMVNSVIRDTDF